MGEQNNFSKQCSVITPHTYILLALYMKLYLGYKQLGMRSPREAFNNPVMEKYNNHY